MQGMPEAREDHKLDLAVEVLRSSGAIRLQALGTSMLPSIWPGDVLRIEAKPGEEIVPGDIVLVARNRRFFIHRLIEKRNAQWITRGDSLPQNDAPVAQIQVLGKVSTIHRKSRVIPPNPRVSLAIRLFGWTLCRWDSARNVALRIHSLGKREAEHKWCSHEHSVILSVVAAARSAVATESKDPADVRAPRNAERHSRGLYS
jgi:signal peptidase I